MTIVQRALDCGVTDIGQITPQERRQLEGAAKRGVLFKTWSYAFPRPKRLFVAMPPGMRKETAA
ncbi:MAG: hypothetical protein EHM35_00490 [Planctomycetaceae bacterium]|nr:MAG: hypothetical protein EHM35_00490 [Planctomycetaceae bacterium]